MNNTIYKSDMDNLYKCLIAILVILFLSVQLIGQEKNNLSLKSNSIEQADKFNFAVNVGFPFSVNDVPNFGFHVGLSPKWRISQYFTIETQLSFTHSRFDREERTNAHDGGQTNSYNAIFGPRFYFANESKDFRPYVHTLIGYGASVDREYDGEDKLNYATYGLYSFSLGAHVEYKKKFNIGAALEGAYTDIIVKIGYSF